MSIVRYIQIRMPDGEVRNYELGRVAYTDNDAINARIAELYWVGGGGGVWTFSYFGGSWWVILTDGSQYQLYEGFNHLSTSEGEVYIIWDGNTYNVDGGVAKVHADIAQRAIYSPSIASYVRMQKQMFTQFTDNDELNKNIAELYVQLSGEQIQSLGGSPYIRRIRYEYQGHPVFYFELYNGEEKTLRLTYHPYVIGMHTIDNIYIIPRMSDPGSLSNITAVVTTNPNYTQIAGFSPSIAAYLAMQKDITTVLNTPV